jgi:hypothetical protein
LLDKEETRTITGLPGFAKIPGAGYLFGLRNNSFTDTELLILITPRRVRLPFRESHDIYAGRGDTSGRGTAGAGAPLAPPAETPSPTPTPTPTPQPGQPAQPVGTEPAPPPSQQPPEAVPNPQENPAPVQPNPRQQPNIPQPPPTTPPEM